MPVTMSDHSDQTSLNSDDQPHPGAHPDPIQAQAPTRAVPATTDTGGGPQDSPPSDGAPASDQTGDVQASSSRQLPGEEPERNEGIELPLAPDAAPGEVSAPATESNPSHETAPVIGRNLRRRLRNTTTQAASVSLPRRLAQAACAAIVAAASLIVLQDTIAPRYNVEASGPGSVTLINPAPPTPSGDPNTSPVTALDSAAVFDAAAPAVVRITTPEGGAGTGFFYAPGKVVTNAHVITTSPQALAQLRAGDITEVQVALHDGRERAARVVGIDVGIDLAILDLGENLDVPVLGLLDGELDPGRPLAVLGHPFGESLMITTGVLSGINSNSRFAATDAQNVLLQIDAAVNPGNSGGPVLDAQGAVAGIVTLRPDEADGRSVAGLALAIPSRVVASAIDQLEQTGTVAYPRLGVTVEDTTPDDPTPEAVKITSVAAGTAAQQAGLRAGDVITDLAGRRMHSAQELVLTIASSRPGEAVTITYLRGTTQRATTATLGTR